MTTALALPPPRVLVVDNPLLPPQQDRAIPVAAGTRINKIADPATHGLAVRLNGLWILRKDWGHMLAPGDLLEVHQFATGSGDSRKVLRLMLTLAAVYFLGPGGLKLQGAQLAVAATAAQLAIGALLPPVVPPGGSPGISPSPTYNVGLGGNQARLDEPIPVVYGRLKFAPPHAMQPYFEYENNDQFYHALFCIGMGKHTLYRSLLGKTLLEHFEDVQTNFLQPGESPTLVLTNVITSIEVSGQDLFTGEYSPPVAACRPRQLAAAIGVDIALRGLGDGTGGGGALTNKSVQIRVEYQQIDDWGAAIASWELAGLETITAATSAPVRQSFKYSLSTPMRVQVRVVRVDNFDDNALVLNEPTWAGLRAYLSGALARPFTIDTTDSGDQLTSWITSGSEVQAPWHYGYVEQDETRGFPAPSYVLIYDENYPSNPAAYAYRSFTGLSKADEARVTLDFLCDFGAVSSFPGPHAQAQVTVQATEGGSGARVAVFGRGTDATLEIGVSTRWDWNAVSLVASTVIAGGIAIDIEYRLDIQVTKENDGTKTITATLFQGVTQKATLEANLVFGNGDYVGFTAITSADEQGVPEGFKTYFDNIRVQATGVDYEMQSLTNNATHLEIRMRASEQLNGLSQNQIYVDVARLIKTWHPDTGWSAEEVETRSPAWALADKWKNSEYGDGLPDSRVDLLGLYNLDALCTARQDRFDFVFDSRTDSDSADQLIARSMRSRVFRRNGVRAAWRDGQQNLPETGYGSRTMEPNSASIDYDLDVKNIPEGIVVEYNDHRSNDWIQIDCPAPGYTVRDDTDPRYDGSKPSMSNVEVVRLYGIQGATHAEREGLYEAAYRFYRRKKVSWSDELLGLRAAWGRPVRFAPALRGWAQSGDVAFWDSETLVAGLTERPEWVEGREHYISFMRDDGSLTTPVTVTPGPEPWDVVLPEAPDFEIVTDNADQERVKYFFGYDEVHNKVVLLTDISPQELTEDGIMRVALEGVVADDRVHLVDNHLLPSPGDIQDPFNIAEELPEEGEEGGPVIRPVVRLNTRTFISPDGWVLEFGNNGRFSITTYAGTGRIYYEDEWVLQEPIEVAQAALFEIKVTPYTGSAPFTGGDATGVWHSLATSRTFSQAITPADWSDTYAVAVVIIRDAETLVEFANKLIYLLVPGTPGGGF